MTRTASIAMWHNMFPGKIAGSVYAVPVSERARAARELADGDLDVHVDVMAVDEGLPTGVAIEELRDIAAAVDATRIGVQLIGSTTFVDAVLTEVLVTRPAKVFLPWHAFTAERVSAVRAAGSAAWIALWTEWDGHGVPRWPTPPDGALVMLIEPGTSGPCLLSRLAIVAACAAELPVNVDGGVTEDVAPLCLTAGAESIVVGRALLAPAARERKAI
ncbi:ribulose phosphate epimerase [Mycolicibacterium moriokaense]|nr:ribulose phosphate epimerase [Mycolicibacterium moriokaense]